MPPFPLPRLLPWFLLPPRFLRLLILLALLAIAIPASADPLVLKAGYSLGPDSHYGQAAQTMAEVLERSSGGRFRVQSYSNNLLGDERELIEGARLGSVDIVVTSSGPVGNVVPDTLITDIPFLFRDRAHARAVLDGPIGQAILAQFPAKGLVALAWGENGFRNLTNSERPVVRPEDLRGLTLRTMENPVHILAFRTLGARPVPMVFSELYEAMERRQVDGQENPLGVILSAGFAKVQTYLSLTEHVYSPGLILLAGAVWERLTPSDRELFLAAGRAGAEAMRHRSEADAASGIVRLRELGMTVTSEVDKAAFQAALAPAYAEYAKSFGADRIEAIRTYPGP